MDGAWVPGSPQCRRKLRGGRIAAAGFDGYGGAGVPLSARQVSARQGCFESHRKSYRNLSRNDREDDHGEESEVEDQEVEEGESQKDEEDKKDCFGAQEEARGSKEERPQEAGCQEGQG
jgi:hypothetical protein